VDSLVWQGKVVFSKVSRYLDTPFEVAHGGGIFRSMALMDTQSDAKILTKINSDMLTAFGLKYGASHSEYIKDHLGNYFFLETSSRVGGANLAEMVEAATGINLWAEWAAIEIAYIQGINYKAPKSKKDAAGIIVSLSRFENPDIAEFTDPEISWRMHKKHHIGFVVASPKAEQIQKLLDDYMMRIKTYYHASLPAPDRPTN
jgi:hypothetical protein